MSETDVQAATSTVDCKIAGCTETAVSKFGPGAGLCHRHRGEVKQGLIERPKLAAVPARRHTPPSDGFEGKAKRLVSVGRSLDRALAKYKPAKADLEAAMSQWRAAIADLSRSGAGAGE
jgi:hypothetical protein